MTEHGFGPFIYDGTYFMSSYPPMKDYSLGPQIGSYRVSLCWKICAKSTIVAQQVQDSRGNYYFRHWNP